jgi:ABC-type phosphate transport system ATPase subunit
MNDVLVKELKRGNETKDEFARKLMVLQLSGYKILEKDEDYAKLEVKVKMVTQNLNDFIMKNFDEITIDPENSTTVNPFEIGMSESLPYNVKTEQILTQVEFEKYKKDNKPMIEDILDNGNYNGYKFYTILFLNDTADEVFIKIAD